jgi:antitoxin HigA-1
MERKIKHNTHPGELLREDVIEANNLQVSQAAILLNVTRPTLSKIINGRAAISPNMAIRIAKVFGGNAEFWLRMQILYDLRKAEEEFDYNKLKLERFHFDNA